MGNPIVSRLENQDVTKTQVGQRIKRINKENINTTQSKEENILSSVTTTEKSKRELLNQKYKTISQNVTANINLQKRDDFSKNRGQKYTKYTTNKQYEDESEVTSDSHISKKVIKDIKKPQEKPKIIPRTRQQHKKEISLISDSLSRQSIKATVDTKQRTNRASTKPKGRSDESDFSSDNLSNMGRRVIKETTLDKSKGQRSQSNINKRITYTKTPISYEESEKGSDSSSHHYQKVTVDTKSKGKNKAASPKEQVNKYLSKKIEITPSRDETKKNIYVNQGQKFFSKNIIIQPVNAETKKGEYSKYSQGIKTISTNDVKTSDLLKDVKYFKKNIVIEPATKGKYNIQSVSIKDSENKWSTQSGRSQINKIYSKGAEKRPWEIDSKNGEDGFSGRYSNEAEIYNEEMLRKIPGINENTKFYHKTITITPVIIPPPKFSQQ